MTVQQNGSVPPAVGSFDGQPLIAARGLSVGYGRIPVVRALDPEDRAGEVGCLRWAHGAGETTTRLALAGEPQPLGGSVVWLGTPVRTPLHVRARQGLGYVPEERSIIRGLSVLDNLRIGRGSVDTALEFAPELKK